MTALAPATLGRVRLTRVRAIGGGWLVRASAAVLVLFAAAAVFAPLIAPYHPEDTDLRNVLAGPSGDHWLGTDQVGRDTLSRLIYGARTSLVGPLFVVMAATALGVMIGLIAGWRRGWVDSVVSRALDIAFAFPALLLAILAVALFGKGLVAPVVAMSIAYTPFIARQVRGMVIAARVRPYVAAYTVQGSGPFEIAVRRVLPNIAPLILAQATLMFGYALLDLAAMSFLGLGVQPPTADWGAMINESRGVILQGDFLTAIVPSVAVVVTVIAFNVIGEDLADRIARRDP
jgi:peptide/nickel transport system permease protein